MSSPILPINLGPRPEATPPAESQPDGADARAFPDEGILEGLVRRARAFAADLRRPDERTAWAVIGAISLLLLYSYLPGLGITAEAWATNPQYQHGWIVPVASLLLLLWWRKPVGVVQPSARAAGFGLLAASFLLRLACANYRIVTIDMYTLVPALLGVFLLAGGWGMFRWAWAPIATLIFMYPLPDEATRYITGPLQTFNTIVSTLALQTLGLDAFRDGNRIILGDGHVMNVVDACAGLKMLTIFIWLAAMIILVSGLEWWENVILAVSAIPIAVAANTLRITTAGVLYHFNSWLEPLASMLVRIGWLEEGKTIAETFHDSTPAAVLMMLVAIGLLLAIIRILSHLVVSEGLTPTTLGRTVVPTATAARTAGPARVGGVLPVIPRVDSGQNRPRPGPGDVGGKK